MPSKKPKDGEGPILEPSKHRSVGMSIFNDLQLGMADHYSCPFC